MFQLARSASQRRGAQKKSKAMPATASAGGMWELRVHGVEASHNYYSSYASYVANLVFVVVIVRMRITHMRMSRRGMGGSGRVGTRRGGRSGGG